MCGIIGILGKHEAAPILIEALKRLEYRGYDSSGIATLNDDGSVDRRRAVGKLVELQDKLVFEPLKGKAGLGIPDGQHTESQRKKCSPHTRGAVSVVHNGIIENFLTLREELKCEVIKLKQIQTLKQLQSCARNLLMRDMSHSLRLGKHYRNLLVLLQ